MKQGKVKKIPILISLVLLIGSFSVTMNAPAQETNLITGNMYAMYFLYMSNNKNVKELSQIDFMFNDDGSVSAMDMKGHGLYFAIPGAFTSTYFADNAFMNFEMMDIFIAMTGITFDPFISGVGFFLIDYVNFVPFVFTGRQLAE
jgi:hypothetical protein